MPSNRFKGKHYSVDDHNVRFFGARGSRIAPSRWTVNLFGDGAMIEIIPESLMELVATQLARAAAAGRDYEAAQLRLSPPSAVIFFLEGRLHAKQFASATEKDDHIEVANVRIGKYRLAVRIYDQPAPKLAITDHDGKPL